MSASASFAKGFFQGFFTVLAFVALGLVFIAVFLMATGKLKLEFLK